MNASVTIDANLYQFAAAYARQHKVSVSTLIESYLIRLRDRKDNICTPDSATHKNVLPFDQLRPELQEILALSAPMKGKLPEWDLNGDLAREEVLQDIWNMDCSEHLIKYIPFKTTD